MPRCSKEPKLSSTMWQTTAVCFAIRLPPWTRNTLRSLIWHRHYLHSALLWRRNTLRSNNHWRARRAVLGSETMRSSKEGEEAPHKKEQACKLCQVASKRHCALHKGRFWAQESAGEKARGGKKTQLRRIACRSDCCIDDHHSGHSNHRRSAMQQKQKQQRHPLLGHQAPCQ